jgi:thioredoxin 1
VSENAVQFTAENWEREVLKSETPVLVDFWAEWCPPCKMVGPTIDALAAEYAGRVKIGKLDVDANQAVADAYGIRSIPSLLFFRGGQVVDQRVGAAPAPVLRDLVEAQLGAVLTPR